MALGHVLTANRLSDGIVVFLTAASAWSEKIDEAVLAREPLAAGALEKRGVEFEDTNLVTGAYLIEAERQGGSIVPTHVRECIRACGPTVAYLGAQTPPCQAHAPAVAA